MRAALALLARLEAAGVLEALLRPPATFRAVWDWWAATYLQRKADRATLAQQARDYLLPQLGDLKAGELMPAHVEAALELVKRSPRTVNGVRGLLRLVIRDAQANGKWPGSNPVDAVKPKRIQRRIWPTLTAPEARALLESSPPPWRLRWALSIYLGLRPGEVRALRRSDVQAGQLLVARSNSRDTTKTGAVRVLPICAELAPLLAEHLALVDQEPDALLFPRPRGGVRPAQEKLSLRFRTALRRAGISREGVPLPSRAYDLRHTFHALARVAGVNREVIRMAMGHAGDITGAYGQPSTQEMRAELGKLQLYDGGGGTMHGHDESEAPVAGTTEASKDPQPSRQEDPKADTVNRTRDLLITKQGPAHDPNVLDFEGHRIACARLNSLCVRCPSESSDFARIEIDGRPYCRRCGDLIIAGLRFTAGKAGPR